MQSGFGRNSAQQATDRTTRPYVDRMNPQDGMFGVFLRIEFKVNVVDADDFPPVYVDDLLIEQVALEQEESLGSICRGPFPGSRRGAHSPLNRGNRRKGEHSIAGLGFDDER
jgi:hypothetical protein